MKTSHGLGAIVVLLAIASALPGYSSVGTLHSPTDEATRAARGRYSPSVAFDTMNTALLLNGSFQDAKEIDLREVDWSKVTDINGRDRGTVIVAENGRGDDEEDEGDDHEGGHGGDEEEAGEGGWDRIWDAPKLG